MEAKSIQSVHEFKGVTFTINSYAASGGRGAYHIANGEINGVMISKSSINKKNLKQAFKKTINSSINIFN